MTAVIGGVEFSVVGAGESLHAERVALYEAAARLNSAAALASLYRHDLFAWLRPGPFCSCRLYENLVYRTVAESVADGLARDTPAGRLLARALAWGAGRPAPETPPIWELMGLPAPAAVGVEWETLPAMPADDDLEGLRAWGAATLAAEARVVPPAEMVEAAFAAAIDEA